MIFALWIVCVFVVPMLVAALRHPVVGFIAGVVLGALVTAMTMTSNDPQDGITRMFVYSASVWSALIAAIIGVVVGKAVRASRQGGGSA